MKILLITSLMLLASCQPDADGFIVVPEDGEAQGSGSGNGSGTSGGNSGSTTGFTTGTTGFTTGTTGLTGGSTGYSTSGYNVGSTNSGYTTSGYTEGSTNSGYTTSGYTQGSTNSGYTTSGYTQGSTNSGYTTSGYTQGSTNSGYTTSGTTEGSTNSGSTTGYTTGGITSGSTDGSAAGGSTGGTVGPDGVVTEEFIQEETKKLEVLWVIDNSLSMLDEQTALASNFKSFADEFVNKPVEFKMAITTTDNKINKIFPANLSSTAADSNPTQFITDFQNMIAVGTGGSGYEQGLNSAAAFSVINKASIDRNAYMAVVIVTDEEESSPSAASVYVNELRRLKRNAGLIKIYTICDVNGTNAETGVSVGCVKDTEASTITNGAVYNIRNSFGANLASIGDGLVNLVDTFSLARRPQVSTIQVFVNDVFADPSHYDYDDASVSIKFRPAFVPANGARVTIKYKPL
ncbi:MAG TPA: vWA domain-containing protein [Bacteriovoracaceae bacterium]|nr:vWA domain-containing protein [Bacteriovoracaceae bacterium]